MKIKQLTTIKPIQNKNYSNSFSNRIHKIEYLENPIGYIIDGTTFIPYHNVSELVIDIQELQPSPLSVEDIETAKTLSDDWPNPKAVEKSLELQKKSKKVK